MSRNLADMSREELGLLFPIAISEPDPAWPEIYNEEKLLLEKTLGKDGIYRIRHIGSTAVPNLAAKPTVDILLEIPQDAKVSVLLSRLEGIGYNRIERPENPPPHLMLVKGYTTSGFHGQAFHVHVRYPGDWDEPYFRDYLHGHPEIARRYVELKTELAKKHRHDRDAYTEAKTAFIKETTALARAELGLRQRARLVAAERKICVFGGDRRNRCLREELEALGIPCAAAGLGIGAGEGASSPDLGFLAAYDLVVGPVPFSRDGKTLYAPLAEESPTSAGIPAADFLRALKPGSTLLAGTLPAGFVSEGFRYLDLTKDAKLYERNLVPTCEGIIQLLLNRIDFTLNGSAVLLTGYGRLGRRLAPFLKAFGAELSIYSAVAEEKTAYRKDYGSGDVADLSRYDLVVNTIPAVLLGRTELATAKRGLFVLDVASSPGGIDAAAAADLKVSFQAAGGIPGNKAPRTVARAMLDLVLENLLTMK